MNKILYIITIALLTLTSCKKTTMDEEILPGEVKILVNKQNDTKAVISDEFNINTIIAIFTQAQDPKNAEELVNPKNENVEYMQDAGSSYWQPISPDKTIMFVPYVKIDMFAYSPKENGTNINVSKTGARTVEINTIKLQNLNEDLVNSDLLYAKATGIDKNNLTANLEFRHLFSKLTLKVKRTAYWSTVPTLVSVGIIGTDLYDQAVVNLYDGTITPKKNSVNASEDLTIEWVPTQDMTKVKLSTETPSNVELIVVPTKADDVKIVIQADLNKYEFKLPLETNFTAGKNYIFNIVLDVSPVPNMTITPTVENWEVSKTHVIIPT